MAVTFEEHPMLLELFALHSHTLQTWNGHWVREISLLSKPGYADAELT